MPNDDRVDRHGFDNFFKYFFAGPGVRAAHLTRPPAAATPTRVLIAVGEESLGTFTGRTSVATAELLGQQVTVFPSHHGGFLGGEFGYAGQPEAFARRLREVLDAGRTSG